MSNKSEDDKKNPEHPVDSYSNEKPTGDQISDQKIPVNRGKVESVNIYEVSEGELELIERGSPSSTLFAFSVFFAGVGASFLANLLITDFSNRILIFTLYLTITLISFITSIITATLWWQGRKDIPDIFKKIRDRIRA
ncbi:hypothetical protein [Leptospira levettii]|uniref:hypothetical protein n=1 Tax=Leptospira levettii TaxID=2023178 RepID=UPI00223D9708|nr:hypothetical protein [Leptospira levettii]MCW7475637.1 hypothetical protein [Leptospira levettii]